MLEAVSRAELDVRELESLIKTEASVLYRLLRYLNSPMFAFKDEIHSVRHALSILGERETRPAVDPVSHPGGGWDATIDGPGAVGASAPDFASCCRRRYPKLSTIRFCSG
jgi:hypothetical protein